MIRINTTSLLRLLAELRPTATNERHAGGMPGMLFHTARGAYGADPGLTTLLVGSSGTGRAFATTHVPCQGTLNPTLLSLEDVTTLRALLAPRVKNNPAHTVDVSRDLTTITVQEPDDLFEEGDKITLHVGDLDDVSRYPWTMLSTHHDNYDTPTNSKGQVIPRLPRLDLSAGRVTPFAQVAKMKKEPLLLFVNHQHLPVQVQIGEQYRGVIYPDRWASDLAPGVAVNEGSAPDADVHAPDLPPIKRKQASITILTPKTQPELPLTPVDDTDDGEPAVREEEMPEETEETEPSAVGDQP